MHMFIAAMILAWLAPAALAAPAPQTKVQESYQLKCAPCHGPDGHAPVKGLGLSFADGEWKHGSSVKRLVEIIGNGVPGTAMLPFKDQFTAPEILALAKYVRSLDKRLKAERPRPKS